MENDDQGIEQEEIRGMQISVVKGLGKCNENTRASNLGLALCKLSCSLWQTIVFLSAFRTVLKCGNQQNN